MLSQPEETSRLSYTALPARTPPFAAGASGCSWLDPPRCQTVPPFVISALWQVAADTM